MTEKPPVRNPKIYYINTPPGKNGRGPSLSQTSKLYKIPFKTLADRSRKEGWVKLRKEFQEKLATKTEEKEIETLAEMNARQIRNYKLLQDKALERLERQCLEDEKTAVKALDTGIRGERVIRGEPTEVQNMEIVFTIKKPKK